MIENLTENEQQLVAYWRGFTNTQLDISYENSRPTLIKNFYGGFLATMDISTRPLDKAEEWALHVGRVMKYGKLSVHIVNGCPLDIFADSYQTIRLPYAQTTPEKKTVITQLASKQEDEVPSATSKKPL